MSDYTFSYLWFKQGGKLHVTSELKYNHVRSSDSFYLTEETRHKKMNKYLNECIKANVNINSEEILKINRS